MHNRHTPQRTIVKTYLLDDSIRAPTKLPPWTEKILTERILGSPPERLVNGESKNELDLSAYFNYYTEQCNLAFHDGGRSISIKTHRDVLEIVDVLKTSMTRDDIRPYVPDDFSDTHVPDTKVKDARRARDGSIDLAARLMLMMDIGNVVHAVTGRKALRWDKGSLREWLERYFDLDASTRLGDERVKLEKGFHVRNLERIAGLQVVFTDNLADHLRLSNDDKVVEIFHQVSFLEYQRHDSLFPDGLADETLRTLALLFPQSEKSTREWFKKHRSRFHSFTSYHENTNSNNNNIVIDPRLIKCGQVRSDDRQIENFTFWHDRLVMLKQVYDEAHPRTVSQWWHDRRDGVQWYTFWVAILVLVLTVFFGVVQSIEGALQVYKAYYPN